MRILISSLVLAASLGAGRAHAQFEPVIAVSGRAGWPVVINGFDATGAVVEGDWGLARPDSAVPNVVNPGPLLVPVRAHGTYYPATGKRPRYGRHEIEHAPQELPRAESYHRSYKTQPNVGPVTSGPGYAMPNFEVSPQLAERNARTGHKRKVKRRR